MLHACEHDMLAHAACSLRRGCALLLCQVGRGLVMLVLQVRLAVPQAADWLLRYGIHRGACPAPGQGFVREDEGCHA